MLMYFDMNKLEENVHLKDYNNWLNPCFLIVYADASGGKGGVQGLPEVQEVQGDHLGAEGETGVELWLWTHQYECLLDTLFS